MDLPAHIDRTALEDLLRPRLGRSVEVVAIRAIRPWAVARCEVRGGEVTTVIVKWLRSNPEGFRVDRRQVVTEAAGLTLVAEVAPGLAPALVAFDNETDLLALEDLAPRRTLHSMLAGGLTPPGLTGLQRFATVMGRLHALTAPSDVPGPWDETSRLPIDARRAARVLHRLDEVARTTADVRSEVDRAVAAIEAPGPFAAFSNGDSGANNCLVAVDGTDPRLIDFEHACRRHALLDAVALHVPGSMWMTVADPVPRGVEEAYRHAAGDALEAVSDDGTYGFGLSAAAVVLAVHKLERFDKLDGRRAGHHSRRQIVTTVERTVETIDRWRRLPAVAAWLHDLAASLRRRWPDADVAFPDDYTLREPFDPDR